MYSVTDNTTQLPQQKTTVYYNATLQRMFFEFEMSLCAWSNPVYGAISVPSILLNGLALFLLFSIKQKRPIVYFLMSLSLADLISPVINVFDIIRDPTCYNRYYHRYYGEARVPAEKLVTSQLQAVGCYAVLGTMITMTSDRIVAVLHPLRHVQLVTTCRARTSIVIIWALSLLLSSLPFFVALAPTQNVNASYVYLRNVETSIYAISLPMLFSVACVTLGFLVIVYGLIFYQIKQTLNSVSKSQKGSIKKSCVTIALIVGTFAFSWLPYGISYYWFRQNPCPFPSPNYVDCYRTMRYCTEITMALVFLNAFFDPLIYIVRDNYVNAAWKKLLKKWGVRMGFTKRWSTKPSEHDTTEMMSLRTNSSICHKVCQKL